MFSSRRMMTFLIALVSMSLISTVAYAEEPEVDRPTGLEAGAHVLSVGFTGGGPAWGGILGTSNGTSIGYFHNFDPQFQFGGGFAMDFDNDAADELQFELNPTAKFFLSTTERTVPYIYGNVDLGYDGDFEFGLGVGLGAEFFPVPEFSIGARAGIGLIDSVGGDFATMLGGANMNFYF